MTKVSMFLPALLQGGAEQVAVNLCRGLVDKGIGVDLLLACPGEQLLPMLPPQVKVLGFQKNRTLYAIPSLVRYMRRNKTGAVISFLTHANIIAIVCKLLASYTGTLVITEHSAVSQNLVGQTGYKNKIMVLLMKLLYPKADKVVAVSKRLMQELEDMIGLKNVTCIYNPVDVAIPTNDAILAVERVAKPDPGSRYTVVAVGRLTKAKNFALLIKSFDQVRKKVPAVLHIVGEGEDRENLEKIIRELDLSAHVFLQGYSNQPKAWMKTADLFVLSSSWEGFALVVAEALSVGTTVVATNCPSGPEEILDQGKYGYLVPVNDAGSLSESILYALEHPMDPAMLMSRAALFSIPNVTDNYLNVVFPARQPAK